VSIKSRLAAAAAAAGIAGLLAAGLGASDRDVLPPLPASPSPALRIGIPEGLASQRYVTRWTVVRTPTAARVAPDARARVVARIAARTPEGTPNLLAVLNVVSEARAALWVRVRLPVLPNGTIGWVPRRDLGPYVNVNTRLVVDRTRLLATLYREGKVVFTAPVGIGADAWPTPAGEYNVRSKLTRYASPLYGPVAFGTTARSAVLTDWPAGGFIGIHGTDQPQLLPGRVSHGCIRMRNGDTLRLAGLMPIGTPLTIR
jgi:lipoprotein-anchoring transpeptidase ErfK/SrfK